MNTNANKKWALDKYKEGVKMLADSKLDFEFDNSSASHAAVVLSNMMRISSEMYIYDTHLEGDVAYEDEIFIDSLRSFLHNPAKSLKIVIRKYNDTKCRLYKEIQRLKTKESNVEIKQVSSEFKEAIKTYANANNYSDVNFAVSNNLSYRLEQFDSENNLKKAKCNFNNTQIATKLSEVFNSQFDTCYNIN